MNKQESVYSNNFPGGELKGKNRKETYHCKHFAYLEIELCTVMIIKTID